MKPETASALRDLFLQMEERTLQTHDLLELVLQTPAKYSCTLSTETRAVMDVEYVKPDPANWRGDFETYYMMAMAPVVWPLISNFGDEMERILGMALYEVKHGANAEDPEITGTTAHRLHEELSWNWDELSETLRQLLQAAVLEHADAINEIVEPS